MILTPTRLEIRKDGDIFVGDLVFDDGSKWVTWSSGLTFKSLRQGIHCTFDGRIWQIHPAKKS